jgi:hypothetical protein
MYVGSIPNVGEKHFLRGVISYSGEPAVYVVVYLLYYTTITVGDCNYISLDVSVIVLFIA